MKTPLLAILLILCSIQMVLSQQDDGVVSLDLPVRNSLVFNRYAINPTFSFVREQNRFISINNKREWVQFDNAPETYLASYSGRFAENIGAGLAVFQQNYGVLTTFGGLLNFAYNAKLNTNSNLTFGLNIGAYKSGVNTANTVTNYSDPSLQNVPSNFLITVSPGINYGLEFLDFGVSVNNLVTYNLENSLLIEDNPKQGIQAHVMHTGYFSGRGFFSDTKFSALIKSEFRKDETIISGLAMLNVPKGLWLQLGYNNVYGISGGIGLNLTKQIALEYNIEKALGELVEFGSSHDITLAYRFIPRKRYKYSGDEEVDGLFTKKLSKRPVVQPTAAELEGIRARAAERKAKAEQDKDAEAKAKLEAEEKAKKQAEEQAKVLAGQKAKEAAEAEAKAETERLAKIEAEEKAKKRAETRAKIEASQKAKREAEAKAKAEQAAQAKLLAEQKAKEDAEQKAKEEAETKARLLAEQQAKEEAETQAKLLAEQKAKEEAEVQAKLLAELKAKEAAEQKAKEEAELLAQQQAKAEAEAQAKLLAEQKAKEDKITNPTDELGKSMKAIETQTENFKATQNELLKQFDAIVNIKDKDLKDLKEENDLSDQGIAVQPKPFKSVTAENNKLRAIRSDLDNVIKTRTDKIDELKALYEQRTRIANTELDEVNLYYRNKIERLSEEQLKAVQARAQLDSKLETIRVATEFEKRRRIKRAAYENQEDRYSQDRATLKNIKQTTTLSSTPLKAEDFDSGEALGNNIKILKNIKDVESGYYLVIAVHSNIEKRNDFVTKVVASGRSNVDFFYDVTTSKYYIYYDKFDSIQNANNALKTKGDRPYNQKMSIVKIEN
ncbi:PorP/SprF family type IX secretion system membrane protein [Winogradskyella echinorum]|uniref:PorP/SprF family type IX secretion system membrane protein n=1 Tax=Winogradskyella echinorum TaxID=538189 RepID=A0ABR6Y0U3_9FLAO|nr:PorP/SprF family type IX secretion system membrane protein [Winogradskyella echinorum]MBC3846373.1 PorP/SprF family type IX secretion system membrane protein [Winogradskyella echinorum]MBC5750721.1 PorP/SprF family type IX secretion system membrane protein [Winogradskyella echinorum]